MAPKKSDKPPKKPVIQVCYCKSHSCKGRPLDQYTFKQHEMEDSAAAAVAEHQQKLVWGPSALYDHSNLEQDNEKIMDEIFKMTVAGDTSSPLSKRCDAMWGRDTGPPPPKTMEFPSPRGPINTSPIATELAPTEELYDNLVVLDHQLDLRYREVIKLSQNLPLPPGDQIGPGMVERNSSWVRDTIRRLKVIPTFGAPRISMLVESMLKRAEEMEQFMGELRPQLGVVGPIAEDEVIDTSKSDLM
jgi:hypothetical protein